MTPTVRYGITDNWDVSLYFPIVDSFLKVRNETIRNVDMDSSAKHYLIKDAAGNFNEVGTLSGIYNAAGNELDPTQVPFIEAKLPVKPNNQRTAAGSATGLGDLTLHTKYQFWRNGLGGGAVGLNLQLPTGEERNFHGTGKTHLFTFLYLSQIFWERFEPHLNIGVDINTDDVDRSSFLYTVGGSLLTTPKLGVVFDFIGESEFQGFPVHVPEKGNYIGALLDRKPTSCSVEKPCFVKGSKTFSFFLPKIKRNDIVNFSFGFRYALGAPGSLFFGGTVPISDDGFQADFIPSGGIEFTF